MIKVVSVEIMRQIEAAADAESISYAEMMENAGHAVAERALNVLTGFKTSDQPRITVLVGPGNNGGDGLVAGRIIAQESNALVRFYLTKKRDENDPNFKAVEDAKLFIAYAEDDQRYRVLVNLVASAHIVIDGLFGIGVRLPLKDDAQKILRQVRQTLEDQPAGDVPYTLIPTPLIAPMSLARRPYVIAVDCPSGLNCDTGALDKNALRADETVTFIAAKPGLFMFPGAEFVGDLTIARIGVPETTTGLNEAQQFVVDADTVRTLLPARPAGSHKGTFGKVLIIGGSVNYTGAAGLAASGAYRIGAGLVTVGAPAPVIAALSSQLLETTWVMLPHDMGVIAEDAAQIAREEALKADALLAGPGMGREATTRTLLATMLERPGVSSHVAKRTIGFTRTSPSIGSKPESESSAVPLPPLVIDADGLNLLSDIDQWWTLLPENTILTPHPGEMARLTGLTTTEVQADRWEIARSKAAEWKAILVLKGAHTIIAAPDGRIAVLPFKTAALAKAGTGDVLAGLIVGLLAQGVAPFDAAVAGSYVHGLAGQLMGEQIGTRSTLAGDVATHGVPQALRLLERR